MEDIQLSKIEDGEILDFNSTSYVELPIDMRFNDGHLVAIVTYSILMMISAAGNITVLITTIKKNRKAKSRIQTLIMHLSIADLFVSTYNNKKCNFAAVKSLFTNKF